MAHGRSGSGRPAYTERATRARSRAGQVPERLQDGDVGRVGLDAVRRRVRSGSAAEGCGSEHQVVPQLQRLRSAARLLSALAARRRGPRG